MKVQDVAIPEPTLPALHVQKILVPIDFSTPCNKAFKYALGFARQFGSQIVMIHVIEPAGVLDTEPFGVEGLPPTKNELALAEEKMQALADASRDGSLHIALGIRRGVATHEIVQAADELDVDLIIIAATPTKTKSAQEFYDAVRENFAADRNVNPMRLTEAVLKVLRANTSPGELEKVFGIFPPELRTLCLERKAVDLSDLE